MSSILRGYRALGTILHTGQNGEPKRWLCKNTKHFGNGSTPVTGRMTTSLKCSEEYIMFMMSCSCRNRKNVNEHHGIAWSVDYITPEVARRSHLSLGFCSLKSRYLRGHVSVHILSVHQALPMTLKPHPTCHETLNLNPKP